MLPSKVHSINLPATTIITNTTCCHGQVIRHFIPYIEATTIRAKRPLVKILLLD